MILQLQETGRRHGVFEGAEAEQRLPRCSLDDRISLPLFVLECKNGVTISQCGVIVLDSRVN